MNEEDVINYWIIVHDKNNSLVTDLDELNSYSEVFSTFLHEFTENYIWNRDPFYLDVCRCYTGEDIEGYLSPCLYGRTNVGEHLEDEWFITFLLVKLCERFSNIVIRVSDTDGEYLLTEAADFLPRWSEYKNAAQQRVFLHRGSVHLVPPPGVGRFTPSSPPPTTVLPIMEGISKVSTSPSETLASPQIQGAIKMKIDKYPLGIRREQHVCHMYVPVGVAALLREYPTLVAPAVNAFTQRDHMDTKALRVMRHFPPEQRVMTAVRFSKALYAKLSSSSYFPERITGWNLPPASDEGYKSQHLGVKLACGFELLVCNAGGITPTSPSDNSHQESVTSNPRWGRYKQSLTNKGYFRGELPGSKLYKELEMNALRYFTQNLNHIKAESKDMDTLSAGAMIIKLLSSVNKDLDFFKEREKRLVPQDDESWLNISPDMLDEMLQQSQPSTCNGNNESSEQQLQSGLEAFLKTTSDFEGAEINDELQEKLRKLSSMSLPRRKESLLENNKRTPDRKKSNARKVSTQMRKISSQSTASNASQMSSLSNKIDLNAEAFSDAFLNCIDKYFEDDSYFQCSDDESSGLSSYGDENEENISEAARKISSGSTVSGASSGIDADMKSVMKEMETQLKGTTIGENLDSDDDEEYEGDEFDDAEDFEPVKVDAKTVEKLVASFREERKGGVGPATTLFASLGLKPK